MKLTRAQFIGASAAAFGGISLSGCTQAIQQFAVPEVPKRLDAADADPAVWRVLNRAAYGPRLGDVERVSKMGVDAYIEEQLAPEKIQESPASWLSVGSLDTLDMDAADAMDWETASYPEVGKGPAAVELQQACVLRAVYSIRQLEQVMVDFWTDHFNISQLKAECSWLKTMDDRLIRKHALGKFRDLVAASAHSAAMLFYLDNDKNRKQDAGSGPNENYARELLELHTLGVNGGYSLQDIQEVARCFTGWSYNAYNKWQPGTFVFHASHHDDGPKRVLGHALPAGQGVRDGERVIDLVCRHPSTARFIARKLCRRFVADRPPHKLVARVAEVFQRTDGDIRQVLSTLLHSPEFQQGTEPKVKRPFDFAVSSLRMLNATTTGHGVLPYLEKMGQLPYKWAMPDGYPDRVDPWASGLLLRWDFALDLVRGKVDGTSVPLQSVAEATGETEPQALVRSLSRILHGQPLPEAPLKAIAARAASKGDGPLPDPILQGVTALLLAAPQFQWR